MAQTVDESRRPRRRRRILVLATVIAGAAVVAVPGFTSAVTRPGPPRDPATIFLLRDGLHRLLALPDPPRGLAVWSYGDWDWYAQNHDRWYHTFDTVLWPTQATLARREVAGGDEAALRRSYRAAKIDALTAERQLVDQLHRRLRSEFAAGGTPELNRRYATYFTRHDSDYWFASNCNDAVARWLEELDCEVSWVALRLDLEVETQ